MEAKIYRTNLFSRALAIELICYAYILLFLYAGPYKLMDIPLFQRQLAQSPLLGGFSVLLSWAVPILEIIIALLLFVPKQRYIAMAMATAVMAGFTVYIIYLLNFAPSVPCSCGGIMARMGWRDHLLFNSVFVALGLVAMILMRPMGRK